MNTTWTTFPVALALAASLLTAEAQARGGHPGGSHSGGSHSTQSGLVQIKVTVFWLV